MHKVGIDARMWDHPGIGRYIRELVKNFGEESSLDFDFTLMGSKALAEQQFLSGAGFHHKTAVSPIYSLSEQWEMSGVSKMVNLLHTPHFNAPVFCRSKLVVTIHDLIYLHQAGATKSFLGKMYVRALISKITAKADAILTVSEYSKSDLLSFFPKTDPKKVFVTHEAASEDFKPVEKSVSDRVLKEWGIEKPYTLFVGSLKSHKNIPTLLKAMKIFRENSKIDAELLIVGRKDAREASLLEEIKKRAGFVRCLGELPDSALVSLYNRSEIFVLPSLREGFGLPVLEAMACGTPVIVSNRTSLPEIAGGAGLLFNPESPEELADCMARVFSDQSMRRQMSVAGLERAKLFSWKKTAARTLDVYRKVMT